MLFLGYIAQMHTHFVSSSILLDDTLLMARFPRFMSAYKKKLASAFGLAPSVWWFPASCALISKGVKADGGWPIVILLGTANSC